MVLTLAQLAERLGAELRGDGRLTVSGIATLTEARPGDLSFLANPRYRRFLAATRASAVILAEADAAGAPAAVLVSDNPYAAYARAVSALYPPDPPPRGVHASATVDASAGIDASAWIGPGCVVGAGASIAAGVYLGPACIIGAGVSIGAHSRLLARVTVLAAARIGEHAILHPGVVVGSDGFGMARVGERWEKVPQIGSVRIGDDVEIGANTTVDRGALGDTVIEDGVKIDNQVQVAHNVHIGAHTAIAGCVGISGSARIGRHCTLAGGVGLVGHLEIADNVHITGMSMVTRSISQAGTYSAGTPLMENRQWRRNAVRMKQLDDLARRVQDIEKYNKNNEVDK
jgi:UDP-3-O-[3-hydroxymyristoyl] glucosamine N-acyltransferase